MKFVKKFDSISDMNSAIQNDQGDFLGMAQNGVNQVLYQKTEPLPQHDYVEIAGVKWATMNVGASTVTDSGLYFQWGDTVGHAKDEPDLYLDWYNYKFNPHITDGNNGYFDPNNMNKYNFVDGKTELWLEDDAVHAAWGGQWRMPTKVQFDALLYYTTQEWAINYLNSGVNGLLCVDKTDNSKTLFFPASSYVGNLFDDDNIAGWVMSCSRDNNANWYAHMLMFYHVNEEDYSYQVVTREVYYGYTVRGVIDETL